MLFFMYADRRQMRVDRPLVNINITELRRLGMRFDYFDSEQSPQIRTNNSFPIGQSQRKKMNGVRERSRSSRE